MPKMPICCVCTSLRLSAYTPARPACHLTAHVPSLMEPDLSMHRTESYAHTQAVPEAFSRNLNILKAALVLKTDLGQVHQVSLPNIK